jgi:MtN3 and saliva related transmembrane protein
VTESVGWASSVILLLTIIMQVKKQWQSGSNEGVSRWLFTGQLASSVGFTVYSVLTWNLVFIFTNSILLLSNIVGVFIFLRNRRAESSDTVADSV